MLDRRTQSKHFHVYEIYVFTTELIAVQVLDSYYKRRTILSRLNFVHGLCTFCDHCLEFIINSD